MNIGYAAPTEDALEGQSRKIGSAAPAPASVTPPLPPTQEEEVSEEAQKGDTGELHTVPWIALCFPRVVCAVICALLHLYPVVTCARRGQAQLRRMRSRSRRERPRSETPSSSAGLRSSRYACAVWRHHRLHNSIIMLLLHVRRSFPKKRTRKMPSETSELNFE